MTPRGFITLLSGGAAAQIIAIAALPLLGRLYDPVSFGQLGAVMALVSVAVVLVHGRYQLAVPVAPNDEDARALIVFAVCASLLLSMPVVLGLFVFIGKQPSGMSMGFFLTATAVITALTALVDIFAYWRSREGRFRVSAANAIARTTVAALLQIGLAAWSGLGLLVGVLAGTAVAVMLALLDIRRHEWSSFSLPPLSRLRRVALQYRSYPLFGVPQGFLAALSWNAMPLLLLRFGETAFAGQYWVAYRLLLAPLTLFNGTYRQSVLPLLRTATQFDGLSLIRKHSLLIATAGLVPAFILYRFGEPVFLLILGSQWGQAGTIAGWIGIAVLADAFKVPAICLLQSRNRQGTILVWEAAIVTLRYLVAIPLLWNGQVVDAIAAFACIGFAGWALFCLVELRFHPSRHVATGKV